MRTCSTDGRPTALLSERRFATLMRGGKGCRYQVGVLTIFIG